MRMRPGTRPWGGTGRQEGPEGAASGARAAVAGERPEAETCAWRRWKEESETVSLVPSTPSWDRSFCFGPHDTRSLITLYMIVWR